MDNDILKLLPKKAFKLISIKETIKIGALVTKSMFDKESQKNNFKKRFDTWKFDEITLAEELGHRNDTPLTKEDGEKVLKIYFSQFFEKNLAVHLDLRKSSFSSRDSFVWSPSKLHYNFTPGFLEGVCNLYEGFYFDENNKFEKGLIQLGMINELMSEKQKNEMKEIFYKHFGEGKVAPVAFCLENLHSSFNAIFSHFLKEDIPLNPEFAVLGVYLVTLYLTLQDIPQALDVSKVFKEVVQKYS